jgi:transcriptional regulator with XRE-family HTH domain
MAESEKGAIPDELKDAIAENLRNYMRRELYEPDNPNDIKRLADTAGISIRTLERLLRRETYPENQPALKSLANLATALRVETHHLVYKPRVTGPMPPAGQKPHSVVSSSKQNKGNKR